MKRRIGPLDLGHNGAAPIIPPVVINRVLGRILRLRLRLDIGLLLGDRPADLEPVAASESEPASPPVGLLLVMANGVGAVREDIRVLVEVAVLGRGLSGEVTIVANHASVDLVLAIAEDEGRGDVSDAESKG